MPDFAITTQNVADVIRLCQRLDGIPLAIELAAMPLRTLPLTELVERLDHRFALLSTGRPGALPRHKTLRTAIEWSYELCSAAERRLWARLSVFAGRFSLDAAEEVCAEVSLERPDVVNALIGLVDKSVVLREGEQYRMLDTLREFGAEQLRSSGEEDSCRSRHIARYLAMARYFGVHFADDDQMDRYRELREVHPNLRAAMEYALEPADGPLDAAGAELACSLYGYWQISGLLGEGTYWLTKVLDRFPVPSRERGWALACRCYLGAMQGAADEAVADGTAGTEIGIALGDERLIGRGYNYLTLALTIAARYEEARAAAEKAERTLDALGDRTGLAILDAHWAHLSHLAGDPEATLRYAARGLSRFDGTREWWASAWMHAISAMALYGQPGREAETARAATRSLLAKHELGDMVGMAYCLEIHGWLAARAGLAGAGRLAARRRWPALGAGLGLARRHRGP